jgi:hypothetical protein
MRALVPPPESRDGPPEVATSSAEATAEHGGICLHEPRSDLSGRLRRAPGRGDALDGPKGVIAACINEGTIKGVRVALDDGTQTIVWCDHRAFANMVEGVGVDKFIGQRQGSVPATSPTPPESHPAKGVFVARILTTLILVSCVVPAAARSQVPQSGTIQSTSAGGQTIVYIAPIWVGNDVMFSAAFAYSTGAPTMPDRVQLSFGTGPHGPRFEQSRLLTFLLDQQTELPIGMMEFDAENNMVRRFVPVSTFRQIAQANHVSGQVGAAAFTLPPAATSAMRQLLARIDGVR